MTRKDALWLTAPDGPGGGTGATATGWARIKQILDQVVAAWKTKHHRDPDLAGKHGPTFGWSTKAELRAATVTNDDFGLDHLPLIEPEKVGNNQGQTTNLVRVLKTGLGDLGVPRMPEGGPFLSDGEIKEIADWIDAGMPD
jgi:hypothetical protein